MREPNDAEWAVIEARQPMPGFYAVTSTRIVCRPTCPARMPLRRNLRMVETLEEAFAAGFRACKRCKPDA